MLQQAVASIASVEIDFSPTSNNGVITTNDELQYTTITQGAPATWELKPTFSKFSDAEIYPRNYDTAPATDHLLRSEQRRRL